MSRINGKAVPVQGWTGPDGSRRLRLPDFMTTAHEGGKGLSALRIGLLYRPGNIPGTHLCYRLSRPEDQSAAGKIMSMKNSIDSIGNLTRDQLRHSIPRLGNYRRYKCACIRVKRDIK